ncbi:MAG TPA: phosphoribosylamine--glycine ligase [Candidatus Limnocylindrales bacterium]|nr:phosphoribosylamine--glycine ligase [Candidatus Limnocylindrales bacterium]
MPIPRTILVLGDGGREHALCWRLGAEPGVERVIVGPGNALMEDAAEVHPELTETDIPGVMALCRAERVDLVVVGPEAPLVGGLVDALGVAGVPAFGPGAAAARLEGSKAFTREICRAAGVPTARGASFTAIEPALAFAATLSGRGCVVKADGLAAGKGVTVCPDEASAEAALREALVEGRFGVAGARVVVEERLTGSEASLICICDATGAALALPAARDHKRLLDGDRGPNTGGMGAISPLDDLDELVAADLVRRIHLPVLAEMAGRGTPFRGALYAGLMLTAEGPRLLEFNVRLGDPETQVILPRLAVPLALLLAAAAADRLTETATALGVEGLLLPVAQEAAVGVVLAAAGYPGRPRRGEPIDGLDAARAAGGLLFGAGVGWAGGGRSGPGGSSGQGGLVTAGGRIVTVVGRGASVALAAEAAYGAADQIDFGGLQRRSDVGRSSMGAHGLGSRGPGHRAGLAVEAST